MRIRRSSDVNRSSTVLKPYDYHTRPLAGLYALTYTRYVVAYLITGDADMRTTLVIPDTIYRRAKKAAKQQGKTLSDFFAESVEVQLARGQKPAKKPRAYQIKPVEMGLPKVDVNDRDALFRAMEE